MNGPEEPMRPMSDADRRVVAWLVADAGMGPHRAPDRLYENVFARTREMRQRPAWLRLPVGAGVGDSSRSRGPAAHFGIAPLVAAAIVVTALLALAVGLVGSQRESIPSSTAAPTAAQSARPSVTAPAAATPFLQAVPAIVLDTVGTCRFPGAVTYAFDSLWVACAGSMERIDPATRRVQRAFDGLGEVAAGPGAVWAVGAKGVVTIDPATNAVSAPIADPGALAIAVGRDAIWTAATASGTVARIDPAARRVTSRLTVGGTPLSIVAAAGSVWVADSSGNRVVRIDEGSGMVAGSVPVGRRPVRVTSGDGLLWTVDNQDGRLSRIDPASGAVTPVDVEPDPTGPGSITTSVVIGPDGTAYATSRGGVFEIARGATSPYRQLTFANGVDPAAAALVGADLWMADGSASLLQRIVP